MSKETNIKLSFTQENEPKIGNMKLDINDNLENALSKYKGIKSLRNKLKESKFYLKRNNQKILLDKKTKIKEHNLKEGDLIVISFKENINNIQNTQSHYNPNSSSGNLNEEINTSSNIEQPLRVKKNCFFITIITVAIIIIGIIIFLIIYFINKNKINKISIKDQNKTDNNTNNGGKGNYIGGDIPKKKIYYMEELITQRRPYYPNNMIFLYKSDKIMNIELETELNKVNDESNMTNVKEYMDFGLIIRKENNETFEDENLIRKWFTGYIILLNLTINNGTHDMSLNYNEDLIKLINGYNNINRNNLRNLNEINNYQALNDGKELCFVKINFYENGEIKNIYYPEEFNIDNMVYMNKIAKLIIPKLSKNLYSENIIEKIKLIDNSLENIEEEEEYIEKISYEYEQDNFDDNSEPENIFPNEKSKELLLRRNSENDTEVYVNNSDEYNYDYLSENELEIDNSNSSNENFPKYYLKGIEENETHSNITDFEMESLESAQAKLEGSILRRIKNTFIDEKGMLIYIIESENITINQPGKESLNDLTEEEEKLKSEIYNDNNEIPRNDEEDFAGKNISFNISNIKSVNVNNISLYDKINNEELAKNIFKYLDSFSYIKYNNIENDELKFRVLKEFKDDFIKENKDIDPSQIEVEHSKLLNNKNKKRKLQNSGSYYSMKNYKNEKIIYKYNLIGLNLEGSTVSEINVANGESDNFVRLTSGSINLKYKFNNIKTNMHIITKNTNKMTYKMMFLLYNSNEELIKRNKIYSDIILDLEKNVTKLLEDYYDYSGLFRDSLEYLYDKVKNFSGKFFNELIELIENVYDNFTIILNISENEEFDIMNEIRNITKNEYMNYINNMFDLIINFKNDTLLLLINIKKEVDIIQTFQLDILYDIIDLIYDSISVFKDFNKKLFKAVDRGVTTFKYDLWDYMEERIGELLYLTDFLSVNINKNEILKNAIDLEKRQNITIKLKNFRNIILRIIEIINTNIINDYNEEMSSDNENSIKYSQEYIIKNTIEEIDNNSFIIIEEIKAKIHLMNYYETYAEGIQIINEINNKSLLEFNNEIYEQVLINISKISPEYSDKNSDLVKNKNYLLSISNDISSIINQEIIDINNYIDLYSTNYINDNNYFLDYNLYNFRKYFKNEFISSLLNDFKTLVKNSLQVHYINLIKKNYDLAFQYMEEVLKYFKKASHYRILGNIFITTYNKYKAYFQEFAYGASSEEYMNFISKNFYNVTNFVLNHINKKLQSIKKYYLNEANNNNFYILDLIQEEISKLSKNINNYFNEMTLETDIKQMILTITLNEIPAFNKEKEKQLDNLYNKIYKLTEETKIYDKNCEIIQLEKKKKRLWYTFWSSYKIKYYYYCRVSVSSRNNIKKIVKNLSLTKDDLIPKFHKLINNYINKFDIYLNNYVNCTQTLYDNLYKYTEEKINNSRNIQVLLNEYQNIINHILINNNKEKIAEKSLLNNINNITTKLENNIFEINNNFYQDYYLNNSNLFLEYPDEIILKLNQSVNKLKSNNEMIKNKINLSLNKRLNNIISSTIIFINDINKFNLEYIIKKIKKENIFNKYFIHKTNLLNHFFNSSNNLIKNSNKNENKNKSLLNEENYYYYINQIENNYSEFSSDLIEEIENNFTKLNCINYITSDSINESNLIASEGLIVENCTKEKYSTELNYSKYNFNVVKFRTEISNSKRFPGMFEQLFDDLKYDNIIDMNKNIEIDDIVSDKNILYISEETETKIKLIKQDFISIIREIFDDFCTDFLKQNNLMSNYWPFLNLFKSILTLENISYNNNISETYNYTINITNNLLDLFNSTLSDMINTINNISENYDYISINFNYMKIFNNYFLTLEEVFNNYIEIIQKMKVNNNFYSIPNRILNEIFLEKRKHIKEIINQFSVKYNFESIGFKYNLEEEFDLYLKTLYLNQEFNNTYKYFELIEGNKNIYLNKLLNDIPIIKNFIKNKFNSIINNFNKYIKSKINIVEKDYIEKIKNNNSICLKYYSDLDLFLSNDLNNTNITESDDYIINNCTNEGIINSLLNNSHNDTCLNISGINATFYYSKFSILFSDCIKNNFYNYSYIIINSFEEEDKNNLDEIISNISNTLISNMIDENYLINYLKNYCLENYSLEINMNDYKTYFEDIEDMNFYINNKREPEFKNLMYNILIQSFNISYTNKINTYITNEAINKINFLINDKLNIFIDYLSNKLKNDFEYYSFLLDKIEELGNSSKSSILNIFSEMPKKLNESIYYLIEDEIFYYIDIIFRDNKNIFINNFLKFYTNEEYHFNLSIYKIEDYVKEMISDRKFNKSLNDISSNLIEGIKNQIKNNIRSETLVKMNSFITQCDFIYNQIKIKLNQVKTNKLPDEMNTLVQLLNNYSLLLEKQNNRFSFSIGKRPFDELNIFISQEIEPPLSLILIKYNSIEEDLLNRIKTLADEFPDCYSELKETLLKTKLNIIDDLTGEINSTLFEYQNILVNDIKSYLNKLIHFIYIDGLQTIDRPCNETDCGIPQNIFRRLNNKEIIDISRVYKGHPNLANKTLIEERINKRINFNNKRRTSSNPEFTSDMGSLSENDVVYYLTNLQNTILKFNKSYLGKEYMNMNLTTNKFLMKFNFTYLEKLRITFDLKLVKFSTILTENGINKLKKIILKQYYLIEDYVHYSSNLLQYKINFFLNEINKSSEFIESLSGYIHNQALGYYNILHTIIQSQYKNIDNKGLRTLDLDDVIGKSVYTKKTNKTKITALEIISLFQSEISINIQLDEILENCLQGTILGNIIDKMNDFNNLKVCFKISFPIFFPAFSYLQLRLNFKACAGLGFYASIEPDWREMQFNLVFDVYAEAKVALQIEGGLYFPTEINSPFLLAFVVGLDGVIGHGRAGIKLEICLHKDETTFDVYFIFNALVFQFYFQIRIEIGLPFFQFEYAFDIIRIELFGIHVELHKSKKAQNDAFKKNHVGGVNSPIVFFGSPSVDDD